MATNFEFYKDEILKVAQKQATPVLTRDGDISGCNFTDCKKCAFQGSDCRSKQMNWLYAEHIEQPKLTKRERAFCEAVQTGWIARDCEMRIFLFHKRPRFEDGFWCTTIDNYIRLYGLENDFGFIKDTDAEPWEVSDLLKLDVIEEGEGRRTFGDAIAVFKTIENERWSDEERIEALFTVTEMPTINSIKKDELQKALKWLLDRIAEEEEVQEDA